MEVAQVRLEVGGALANSVANDLHSSDHAVSRRRRRPDPKSDHPSKSQDVFFPLILSMLPFARPI